MTIRRDGYTLQGRETISEQYDLTTVKAYTTFVPVRGFFGMRDKPALLITALEKPVGIFLMHEHDILWARGSINSQVSAEIHAPQLQKEKKIWAKYKSRIPTQPTTMQVTYMTVSQYRSFDSEIGPYEGYYDPSLYYTMLDGRLYCQRFPDAERLLANDRTQRTIDTNVIQEVIQYHYEVCIQSAYYSCHRLRCLKNGTVYTTELMCAPRMIRSAPGVHDESNPKDGQRMTYTVPDNGIIRVTAKHYRLTPPSQS